MKDPRGNYPLIDTLLEAFWSPGVLTTEQFGWLEHILALLLSKVQMQPPSPPQGCLLEAVEQARCRNQKRDRQQHHVYPSEGHGPSVSHASSISAAWADTTSSMDGCLFRWHGETQEAMSNTSLLSRTPFQDISSFMFCQTHPASIYLISLPWEVMRNHKTEVIWLYHYKCRYRVTTGRTFRCRQLSVRVCLGQEHTELNPAEGEGGTKNWVLTQPQW